MNNTFHGFDDTEFNSADEIVKLTTSSYAQNADEYVNNTNQLSFFPGLQQWLDEFIATLPGDSVLDIAFGSGRDLIYMLNKGLKVQGIEMVEEFISRLSEEVKVPLCKMDMRRLQFSDAQFDGLWCCSSFLHIAKDDAQSTLDGFARVLRDDGVLYLSLKEGEGSSWIAEGNVSDAHRYFAYYTLSEITSLLCTSGFEVISSGRQISRRPQPHPWLSVMSRKVFLHD